MTTIDQGWVYLVVLFERVGFGLSFFEKLFETSSNSHAVLAWQDNCNHLKTNIDTLLGFCRSFWRANILLERYRREPKRVPRWYIPSCCDVTPQSVCKVWTAAVVQTVFTISAKTLLLSSRALYV